VSNLVALIFVCLYARNVEPISTSLLCQIALVLRALRMRLFWRADYGV